MNFELKLLFDNSELEIESFKKEIEYYEIEEINDIKIKETVPILGSMDGGVLTDTLAFVISSGAIGVVISKIFEITQKHFEGKHGDIELMHRCKNGKQFSWKFPITSTKDRRIAIEEFEKKIRKECEEDIILF